MMDVILSAVSHFAGLAITGFLFISSLFSLRSPIIREYDWMVTFSVMLLSGFGTIALLISFIMSMINELKKRRPKPPNPGPPLYSARQARRNIYRSQFGKDWVQQRKTLSYEDNERIRRTSGKQSANRLGVNPYKNNRPQP